MIAIAWTAKGLFALKAGKSDPLLTQAGGVVMRSAMYEWATGRGPTATHLADRLAPSAFQVYGFTPRSTKYAKRQLRVHGIIRPYFSPRRLDVSALLVATIKGNLQQVLTQAQRMSRAPHMATLVTKPGIGFTLYSNTKTRRATVRITYPGARALNAGGEKNQVYRQEFADWSRGGGRDAKAILARANQSFEATFAKSLAQVPPRKLA